MNLFADIAEPPPWRVLMWFSCGAASAVAAKLALTEWPAVQVTRIVITTEHEDSDRFARDVAAWVGRDIVNLRPRRYADHFAVIEGERYVNGPGGAKCTALLKRQTREEYQRPGDLHLFGYDVGEADRLDDFRENNPGIRIGCPLIDAGLTKADCKAILGKAGIELPAMYRLGYANNNCKGCVKGGMGYWNRIRIDFPPEFWRMARAERTVGHTVLRQAVGGKKVPLYLDELDPTAGRFEKDQPADCGPLCQVALAKVGLDEVPERMP